MKPKKIVEAETIVTEIQPAIKPENMVSTATKLKLKEALSTLKRHSIDNHQMTIPSNNNIGQYPKIRSVYHTIHVPNRKSEYNFPEQNLGVPFWTELYKSKFSVNKVVPVQQIRGDEENIVRPLYKKDIFFSASLKHLPQYTSRSSLAYHLSVTSPPTDREIEESKNSKCIVCPESFKRVIATMLDFSLLKSPSFLILAVSGFFTMMGFYVPYMYLSDRAKEAGLHETTAVWLISAIGIANTNGRVICGIVSSIPGINALFLTNVALTISGIATMASGLSLTAEYQFTYAIIFGLSICEYFLL